MPFLIRYNSINMKKENSRGLSVVCDNCKTDFAISDAEKQFLKKMKLPYPKLCSQCRSQRRWAVRNQSKLYNRKCDFTGKPMISLYSPDSKHKVYAEDIWWGDKWNPMDFGREFDFARPFFEQFRELQLDVPRRGMHQDGTNQNSEYTTFGMSNKDCYLAFACFSCENTYFSSWAMMIKESSDCLLAIGGELLYGCVDCNKCYRCTYCQDCNNCSESYLLDNCNNCQNCIGCKNLTDKQYYIYNKSVSKEDFEKFKQKLEEGGLEEEREIYNKWKIGLPFRFAHIIASQDCDGDYIYHGKNCHNCFGILNGAEDSWSCQMSGAKAKDMVDCSMAGQESELIYEMQATSGAYNSAFVNFCRFSKNVYYCDSISSCNDCFGCIGLKNKSYCILNKQYSEEEYQRLLPKMIEHMQKSGEWGENFPIKNSPFPYNDTLAQEYYPLTEKQARDKGYQWKVEESAEVQKQTYFPDKNIDKVGSEILEAVLVCKSCGKNYRIIPQEYRLYKILKISIPELCPDCRYLRRMRQRNPMELYHRQCMCETNGHNHGGRCKTEFKTTYSPDRKELVYCEDCYQKTVV